MNNLGIARLVSWLGFGSLSKRETLLKNEIAQQIEARARSVFAETQASLIETSFGLRSQLERRVQDAEFAAKAYVAERISMFKEDLEVRTQDAEASSKAFAEESIAAMREVLVTRVQDAEARAISHSEHRLALITSGLRALGKVVAHASGRGDRLGRERTPLQASVADCRDQIERLSQSITEVVARDDVARNKAADVLASLESSIAAVTARETEARHIATEAAAKLESSIAVLADREAEARHKATAAFAKLEACIAASVATENGASGKVANVLASLETSIAAVEARVAEGRHKATEATAKLETSLAILGDREAEGRHIATEAAAKLESSIAVLADREAEARHKATAAFAKLEACIATSVATENVARNKTLDDARQAISSDYNTQLRNVERRLEFVRTEILYEMQAAALRVNSGARAGTSAVTPRIVDAAKLNAMRTKGLKLNVGCGHIQLEGYLNVDRRDLPTVDIIAEATSLPLRPGEVNEIISSHLVEHFSAHLLESVLLPHWRDLLEPGGELLTVAPDGAAMIDGLKNGAMSFEDFREVLFGAQDYVGDYHYNLITPAGMTDSLRKAGFVSIKTIYEGRRNGKCFEFRISGRKPARE